MDEWAGFEAALYSGAYFFRDNLGGIASWGDRPCWVADYTNNGQPNPNEEPSGCDWWQFSCTHHFPGLSGGVDANIFHGTGREFLTQVRPVAKAAEPFGLEGSWATLNHDGRVEVFAGSVAHRWQQKPGQGFNESGWASLGQPDQGAVMVSVVLNQDGRVEVFVVTNDNEVLHRWQQKAGQGFNDSGWASLGKPGDRANDDTTISAILNKDGRVEVFADVAGEVFHRWQTDAGKGFNPAWASLGSP